MVSLQFLGAAGAVTGSKHMVRFSGGRELLVDCGLFQGAKEWREKNWKPLPVPSKNLEWIVLTHAHLDHVGFLPRLAAEGFHGPVHCTAPTRDLAAIVLPDSGHLQEEEAEFANKKKYSKHTPALPLYTYDQAVESLQLLRAHPFHQEFTLDGEIRGRFQRAGHILGSAFYELRYQATTIMFSGDLGRPREDVAIPEPVYEADYLLLESTYGRRLHSKEDPRPKLAEILTSTAARAGSVVIPAFAVERTEKLMFMLKKLMETGAAPRLPVYVDSPMAVEAVKIFLNHREEYDPATCRMIARYGDPSEWPDFHFCKRKEDSMKINDVTGPHVIISASGMLTGGRVLHHLERRLPDPNCAVVFVGFQAPGTRGQLMQAGRPTVKMFGKEVSVRCRIETLDQFSDHADYEEILAWLKNFRRPPRRTFLVHGEPPAAEALRDRIRETYGWDVHVAQYLETIELS
jgi:metallo-beta-lactamase family protein